MQTLKAEPHTCFQVSQLALDALLPPPNLVMLSDSVNRHSLKGTTHRSDLSSPSRSLLYREHDFGSQTSASISRKELPTVKWTWDGLLCTKTRAQARWYKILLHLGNAEQKSLQCTSWGWTYFCLSTQFALLFILRALRQKEKLFL